MKNPEKNNPDKYYRFDDEKKEIAILRYDTPTPWINYLSNGTFHTFISQAGGGLAFYKSPQIWRITRYRFFHLPTDRSGPYVYIRDNETGEYWCPTNEPAFLKPENWKSFHGLGYTRFESEHKGIHATLTYHIGEGENALIWNLIISNHSKKQKNLSIFAYVEFGMMEFMRELQWQCYNKHQVSVEYQKSNGVLIYKYGVEMQQKPEETPLIYFAGNRIPDGFDGDRDEFVGSYRSESNPYILENGDCTNSTLMGGDPCGVLQFNETISSGKRRTLNIYLGAGRSIHEIEKSVSRLRSEKYFENSYNDLQIGWDNFLNTCQCKIPDKSAQRMINIWNPYQVQRNFQFSRNISYYATGTFRGVGFRDTAQDIISMCVFNANAAKDKIRLLLNEQYMDGHVNHYFFPVEGFEPVTTIHSDDHLWIILSVHSLLCETGDFSFLKETGTYYDGVEASIYEHLVKSIDFTMNNLGTNGFPLMLRSDWNDQMFKVCRQGKGESIWTSFQLGLMLLCMIEIADALGKHKDGKRFKEIYDTQKTLVENTGWDGKWYRRAIMDDGRFLGSAVFDQASVWLNAQSWAVISKMAEKERGFEAMNVVKSRLDTEMGLKLIDPPITTFPDPKDPLTNYNPGTGENAAVFSHANTWAIIAECILGRGDIAFKYYRQLIPSIAMEKVGVWRFKAEPYVYSSNIFGPDSDKFGLANVSWLTGTASWMYVAATQYILGVKPTLHGLKIDPCIPSSWDSFEVEREYRGCRYIIKVKNPDHVCKGIKKLFVDGKQLQGDNIVPCSLKKTSYVEVLMGTL